MTVPPLRDRLAAAPPEARGDLLAAALRHSVAAALGREPEQIAADAPWTGWGVEPAAGVGALRAAIGETLGFRVYPNELLPFPTVEALSGYLLGEIGLGERLHPLGTVGRWVWETPAVEPPAERVPPVVFVLSAPRSGSTLLRVMLEGHPALFSPPELCLLPYSGMAQRERELDRYGYGFMGLGLLQALAELSGGPERAGKRLAAWVARDLSIPEVYRRIQGLAGERTVVDKSPLYTASREWLARAEAIFDGARYVYLYRHPGAVIESFVRMRFERLLGPLWGTWDDDPARFAEGVWARWNRNILRFLEGVEPGRQHWMRYEELVREPEGTLRELCAFVGLPFEPAMAAPYSGERMTFDRERGTGTIGDPNLLTHAGIDHAQAEKWRGALSGFIPGHEGRDVAVRLGYAWPE